MNSLLSMFGGGGSDLGTSLLMQAVGAAMRGEDAQAFMKKLANSHPQLKKVNLNDLMGSAQQFAQQNGVNIDDATKKIDQMIAPMIKQ